MKKHTDKHAAQGGFTLVEIAIVLVIIGLLLGGILKGQEMITQAKTKNVINDFNGVAAAIYGYQDRYRALPGDDKNAASRWAATTSGNGNGIILGAYNLAPPANLAAAAAGDEAVMFWHHLRLSGFVSGSGANQPLNAVNGMMGVQTGDGTGTAGVLAETGTTNPFTGLILCSANLPDKIAISIDAQLDDGKGSTGAVRGQLQTTSNPAIAATATIDYQETGTAVYTVCRSLL